MLNNLLYNDNDHYNPTNLLNNIHKDIKKLSIKGMYIKYKSLLSPQGLSSILLQEVSVECSKQTIMFRKDRKEYDTICRKTL